MVLSPEDIELASAVNKELVAGKSIEQIVTAIPREPYLLLPEHFGIRIVKDNKCLTPAQWMLDEVESRYVISVSGHCYGPLLAIRLWHELFEIMSSNKCFPSRLPSDLECNLGNLFAVHLLMPESDVKEHPCG